MEMIKTGTNEMVDGRKSLISEDLPDVSFFRSTHSFDSSIKKQERFGDGPVSILSRNAPQLDWSSEAKEGIGAVVTGVSLVDSTKSFLDTDCRARSSNPSLPKITSKSTAQSRSTTKSRSTPRSIPTPSPRSTAANSQSNLVARESRRKTKDSSLTGSEGNNDPSPMFSSPLSSSPREIGSRLSRLSLSSSRKSLTSSPQSPHSLPLSINSPSQVLNQSNPTLSNSPIFEPKNCPIYGSMRFAPASERLSKDLLTSNPEQDSGKILLDSYSSLPKDIQTLLSRSEGNRSDVLKFSMAKSPIPKGLVGLRNLGNTCFMNSILQCAFSTPLLMGYFTMGMYKCDLNKTLSPMKGQLASSFADLVSEVFGSGEGSIVGPSSFKKQIEKWAPQFAGYRQQDSHEFLRFMLDGLAEDLNRVSEKPKWKIDDTDVDKLSNRDYDKGRLSWNKYQSLNSSVIFDIFGGQLQSTVQCLRCGYQSVTFEQFLDLSVPIPKSGRSSCQLIDCISEYTRTETLDDKYKCSKCQSWQDATKQLKLYKTPEVLVIHIKRFSSRCKLETNVQFPIKGLSLGESLSSLEGRDEDTVFDLYGISNHMGGLGGGHYIAHILNHDTDRWHVMDDGRVSQAGNMLSSNTSSAYVLFYKKRNMDRSI